MTAPPDPFAYARPIVVRRLRLTCPACPSQWEGDVGDTGSIYVRYRWGNLTARVSLADRDAPSGTLIYDQDVGEDTGDRLGGCMSTAEMQEHHRNLSVR